MKSVGVDLSKEAKRTAVCTILWKKSTAIVEELNLNANDITIVNAIAREVAVIAIDSPFGWPIKMVDAVSTWIPGGTWTFPTDLAFRLRRTDLVTAKKTRDAVHGMDGLQGASPLSVAADKIAMVAWRCCGLISKLSSGETKNITDQLGHPLPDDQRFLIEAYPAAALAMWRIPRQGYKASGYAGLEVRKKIVETIEKAVGQDWLQWGSGIRNTCIETDHALDAFICALVARATILGHVMEVDTEDRPFASKEGWIALPFSNSLKTLFVPPSSKG